MLRLLYALEYVAGPKLTRALFGSFRDKHIGRLQERLSLRGKGVVRAVDTHEQLDMRTFRSRYQSQNRPVVLKGAAKDWPCVVKWDFEFFKSQYGHDTVTLLDPPGIGQNEIDGVLEESTLRAFIEQLEAGGGKYLRFHPFLMEHPELLDHVDQAWIQQIRTRGVLRPEYQVFIGPAGSHTPVHCAMPCNLFVQVHGRKRWLLFEPNDFPLLAPNASGHSYYHSSVQPTAVDEGRYPLFPFANAWEVVLEPGDVFWNPPYMWHCVTNETPSIGFGYRFNNPWLALRASPTLTALRFAARDPNVFQSAYHALRKTNLIVSIERRRGSKSKDIG